MEIALWLNFRWHVRNIKCKSLIWKREKKSRKASEAPIKMRKKSELFHQFSWEGVIKETEKLFKQLKTFLLKNFPFVRDILVGLVWWWIFKSATAAKTCLLNSTEKAHGSCPKKLFGTDFSWGWHLIRS